jgi:hypothetical protein
MKLNQDLKEAFSTIDDEWLKVKLLFEALKEQKAYQILATSVEENSKREALFYECKALDSLNFEIQSLLNDFKTSNTHKD